MQITHEANGCLQTIRERLNHDTLDDWCEAVSGSCSVAARCFFNSVARRVTLFSRVFYGSIAWLTGARHAPSQQRNNASTPMASIGTPPPPQAPPWFSQSLMPWPHEGGTQFWIFLASWTRHTPSEQLDLAHTVPYHQSLRLADTAAVSRSFSAASSSGGLPQIIGPTFHPSSFAAYTACCHASARQPLETRGATSGEVSVAVELRAAR